LLSFALKTWLDKIRSSKRKSLRGAIVLDVKFTSLKLSAQEQKGRRELTFLISDPANPVKAFDRSEAATKRALPR
jgi:hypothetical protein